MYSTVLAELKLDRLYQLVVSNHRISVTILSNQRDLFHLVSGENRPSRLLDFYTVFVYGQCIVRSHGD